MSEQTAHPGVPAFELKHRLARALEQGHVTPGQMADEIGRGVTTIRNYLKGRTVPDRAVLVTWALRCGVPLEWLLSGTTSGPDGTPGEDERSTRWYAGRAVQMFPAAQRLPAAA